MFNSLYNLSLKQHFDPILTSKIVPKHFKLGIIYLDIKTHILYRQMHL